MDYLLQERAEKITVKRQASSADYYTAKSGLTPNKLILCVWWDWKGIIHYELLPPGKIISSDLYCQQLMRLKQEVEKKRLKLINRKGFSPR
ncbi:Histone-lysine N-methyltransferase SETMAR [Eumeta japonica]|uniref:Histone-lysine N-methyltransferase SETMAR n=1 Tax=Eumeta variegata TaxID=151549 RepID=A0A4C1VIG0_EUMVA|nr:Histone-lysine N-methyltransferase SETMAR [Eumeta japonica]